MHIVGEDSMILTLEWAKNPVRISPTRINLVLKVAEHDDQFQFTADLNDIEEHGRQLYEMANRGDFGIVTEGN